MNDDSTDNRDQTKKPITHGPSDGASHSRHAVQPAMQKKPPQKSRGVILLYIGAALAGIALGGALVFTSDGPKEHWRPPTNDDVVALEPISNDQPPPKIEEFRRPEVAPPFRADAVINVPNAGLRTSPSFSAKAVPGNVRQGEGVIILKRQSAGGPEWLQVKTKSGKSGWVLASVVNERKPK